MSFIINLSIIITIFLLINRLVVLDGEEKKPHIIVIIGDDIGWNDFGIHGSDQIPTPNIDALGYNGVILDKFYTQQTCTPSRAALLTGNYPIRIGLQGTPIRCGENRSIPTTTRILPEYLKDLGYRTHLVGKWHLGAAYRRVTPTHRGFDSHFGYWNGFVGYFDYRAFEIIDERMEGLDLHDGFKPVRSAVGRYATELFAEKAEEIIDKHDKDDPLFLILAHLAAHTGQNGVELGVPDINETNRKYSYISDEKRRRFADIVNIMDDSVGRIVEKLAKKQMLENSIVLFFSDNGGQTVGIYENRASNWPLRGLKFTLFEGGVRGTATLYSPLFKKTTPIINRQLFHISDWLPTFYAAAGGNTENLGKIDGVNQWGVIMENQQTTRTEILLNIDEVQGASGILSQNGRYKLLQGSYGQGIYDGYYGDSGRTSELPPYDMAAILKSRTNQAIEQLQNHQRNRLTIEQIKEIRSELDITKKCKSNRTDDSIVNNGWGQYLLFDLENDQCERHNLIGQHYKIGDELIGRLNQFIKEIRPQTNRPVDPTANPKYFNDTWCTWLDREYC